MQCTLLIPHLRWPRDPGGDCYQGLAAPALQRALSRARRAFLPATGMEAWLCRAFEVERQIDWPAAPLTLTIDGGEPGSGYWLRADPVHLQARRDRILLADRSAFSISRDEAQALTASLTRHFAHDRLQFQALHPERWYLRLDADPGIATHALGEAAGGNVERYLPEGKNALRWHAIHNEIQMLLHDHPVNEARESRGEPAINGVWFWGGGMKPRVAGRHFSAVWSDDALALGLAANADVEATPPPADGRLWLKRAAESRRPDDHHLIVLDTLAQAARRGDPSEWRDAVMRLDGQWLSALCEAVRRRVIARLTVVVPGPRGCARYELTHADLWRFWRRVQPLAAFLPEPPR